TRLPAVQRAEAPAIRDSRALERRFKSIDLIHSSPFPTQALAESRPREDYGQGGTRCRSERRRQGSCPVGLGVGARTNRHSRRRGRATYLLQGYCGRGRPTTEPVPHECYRLVDRYIDQARAFDEAEQGGAFEQ